MKKILPIAVVICFCFSFNVFASGNAPDIDWLNKEDDLGRKSLQLSYKAAETLQMQRPNIDVFDHYLNVLTLKLKSQLIGDESPEEIAQAITDMIFVEEGFEADRTPAADADINNVLFHKVLQRRKGVCMTLSILYLTLAQRLDLPFYGVSVPDHFMVRFDNGKQRFNIETLNRGLVMGDDESYMRDFFVREGEPFYMQNLNSEQVLGVLLSNVGAIMTREKEYSFAIETLKAAKAINPKDVEVWTNLGMAYMASDEPILAKREWQHAVRLNKYDDKAHFHLAKRYYFEKNYKQAISHHDEALRLGHDVDVLLLRALEPFREDSLLKQLPNK